MRHEARGTSIRSPRRSSRPPVLLLLLAAVMLLAIVAPVVSILLKIDSRFLESCMLDGEAYKAIGLSFAAAACATLVALLLGVPLAYVCARYPFPGRSLVEALVTLPILIPHVAAGVALLVTFGRGSLMGKALQGTGWSLIDSFAGIVAAMLFVSFAYLFSAVRDGFAAIDRRVEAMAQILGATPMQTFFTIALPQVRRHVISGAVMMWARGISEFGAIVVIAYHPMVASVLLYQRLNAHGLEHARPVAIMLILISLVILIPVAILRRRREKRTVD